jgi:hypothetical protein
VAAALAAKKAAAAEAIGKLGDGEYEVSGKLPAFPGGDCDLEAAEQVGAAGGAAAVGAALASRRAAHRVAPSCRPRAPDAAPATHTPAPAAQAEEMERAAALAEVVSEDPSSPCSPTSEHGVAEASFFDLDSPTAAAAQQENLSESLGLYIITPPMQDGQQDGQQ